MAAWLAPALKAVLPHLGTIVTAVAPVFTHRKTEAAANQMQLLQEQIAELQTAVSQNAENIKELATQLQTTITALEQTAAIAENKIRRALLLSIVSIALGTITVAIALFLIITR